MYYEKDTTHHLQEHPISSMNKSVENLLISSHEVISSINSSSLCGLNSGGGSASGKINNEQQAMSMDNNQYDSSSTGMSGDNNYQISPSPTRTPNLSPHPSPKAQNKRDFSKQINSSDGGSNLSFRESAVFAKMEDLHCQQQDNSRCSDSAEPSKNSASEGKKESTGSRADRVKKKPSWYHVLYPTYKSRSEDFKRIFKDVPDDERLVVDYSCALQREILVHGRLYVSQNYVCFYANIFMWETLVSLRWKDVASITKEKTALVIPNAISICTETDKFFLTTFGARDKTYLMLFRVWQNALIGQPMSVAEMWTLVHTCYGEELGLTSDDEDYVPPLPPPDDEKLSSRLSVESFSEAEGVPAIESPPSDLLIHYNPTKKSSPAPSRLKSPLRTDGAALDPTDLSDTTESEAEKHAMRIGVRSSTVCTALHDGRQLSQVTLPIHIDQLFTLLFTNSKFFLDFHTARKTTDLIQSAWTQNPTTGQKMRTVSFTISLTQAVGPRSSQVTETQIMLPCSRPGHRYSIDVESSNAGIPYADSFSVLTHYCMTSCNEAETSLVIYSQIKFKKNVWTVIKGLIEKNGWAGLEEYFGSLTKALAVECEESGSCGVGGIKRKARRRRRVAVGGPAVTLQSHPPDHLPANLQSSVIDQPQAHHHHHHNSHVNAAGGGADATSVISWVLLVAVLSLTLINGLLYYKLWGLEDAAAYTIMDLHVLRNTPKSDEDWINLLQQQESLHNVEMRKWQRVLHTAAQLLRQTEESLTELQMSMHPTATDKIFSVLKPAAGLKDFYVRRKSESGDDN